MSTFENKEFKFQFEKDVLQDQEYSSSIGSNLQSIKEEMTTGFYKTFEYMMGGTSNVRKGYVGGWSGPDRDLAARIMQAWSVKAVNVITEYGENIMNSYNLVFNGVKDNVDLLSQKIDEYNNLCNQYDNLSSRESSIRAKIRAQSIQDSNVEERS